MITKKHASITLAIIFFALIGRSLYIYGVPTAPIATTLTMEIHPSLEVDVGQSITVSGTLSGEYVPSYRLSGLIADAPINVLTDWGIDQNTVTANDGTYSFNIDASSEAGDYLITVLFVGDEHYALSQADAPITVLSEPDPDPEPDPTVLFEERFSYPEGTAPAPNWDDNRWIVEGEGYKNTQYNAFVNCYAGDSSWDLTHHAIECTLTATSVNVGQDKVGQALGILFRVRDSRSFYYYWIDGRRLMLIYRSPETGRVTLASERLSLPFSEIGRQYTLRIEIEGTEYRCYMDGVLYIEVTETTPAWTTGRIGLTAYETIGVFDDVLVEAL
ncbi:MAG: hypothetical protein ACXACH_06400 [Candidatus Hermodarchaeia archaeon]|jgi:hypothetical protein